MFVKKVSIYFSREKIPPFFSLCAIEAGGDIKTFFKKVYLQSVHLIEPIQMTESLQQIVDLHQHRQLVLIGGENNNILGKALANISFTNAHTHMRPHTHRNKLRTHAAAHACVWARACVCVCVCVRVRVRVCACVYNNTHSLYALITW